jgi:hypothetical protein
MRDMNLDVDSPEKVVRILRNAAEAFYESSLELRSAGGDNRAGAPWNYIARTLERTADRIEKYLAE